MKISCQSCQSKYTIAGRQGRREGRQDPLQEMRRDHRRRRRRGERRQRDVVRPRAGLRRRAPWTLNVAEGDQRTHEGDADDVVCTYRSGAGDRRDRSGWRDGMGDWLPLREIAEPLRRLRRELRRGAPSAGPRAGRERGACREEASAAGRAGAGPLQQGRPGGRQKTT